MSYGELQASTFLNPYYLSSTPLSEVALLSWFHSEFAMRDLLLLGVLAGSSFAKTVTFEWHLRWILVGLLFAPRARLY